MIGLKMQKQNRVRIDQNYDIFGLKMDVSFRIRFFSSAIYQLLNSIYKTMTIECLQPKLHEEVLRDKFGKYIFVFWHRHITLPISFFRTMPHKCLTSKSRDGELISRIMFRFGSRFVRGSSSTISVNKGGGMALRSLIQSSREGYNLVLTPDGPKGPPNEVKKGIVKLASLSGCKILPLGFAIKNSFELSTWDRTVIPLPFSKLLMNYGEPISVPRKLKRNELENYTIQIQDAIKKSNLLAESSLTIKDEKIS
tara:strand:+ start:785 stop:1543 length:759 start_codon:yes stop_codon:yes gene_type:complete